MQAKIISYGNGLLKGELLSLYLDGPYEFFCLTQMVEKMEKIFDEKCFPQAFLSPRTFGMAKRRAITREEEERGMPMKNQCTFEIKVRFRQNATWQGQILWAEKNIKQNFRSVLEMLKLMDEALTEGEADLDLVKWENNEQKDCDEEPQFTK